MLNETIGKPNNQTLTQTLLTRLVLVLAMGFVLCGCQTKSSNPPSVAQPNSLNTVFGGIDLAGLKGWQYQRDGNDAHFICADTSVCKTRDVVVYHTRPLSSTAALGFGKMIQSPESFEARFTQSMVRDAAKSGGTMTPLTKLQSTAVNGTAALFQAYRVKTADIDRPVTSGFVWLPRGSKLHIINATAQSVERARSLSHTFAGRIQF